MTRPPLVRPRMLAAVVAGGVVGVALRELALLPVAGDPVVALPLVTLAVNIAGSLLLGVVVGALGGRHPVWRAFAGTGVMGGFTTYSAFAVQTVEVARERPLLGMLLALVSVAAGLAAAAVGLAAAMRVRRARESET